MRLPAPNSDETAMAEPFASRAAKDRPAEQTPEAGLNSVVERNVHALAQRRQREEDASSFGLRAADRVAGLIGSPLFAAVAIGVVAAWTGANLGWASTLPMWDPHFLFLSTAASVASIFLTMFVLISQNKMARLERQRADLDVQISLLTEHEITKLATLVAAIAKKIGVETDIDEEVEEIKRDVAPESVLDKIEEHD